MWNGRLVNLVSSTEQYRPLSYSTSPRVKKKNKRCPENKYIKTNNIKKKQADGGDKGFLFCFDILVHTNSYTKSCAYIE